MQKKEDYLRSNARTSIHSKTGKKEEQKAPQWVKRTLFTVYKRYWHPTEEKKSVKARLRRSLKTSQQGNTVELKPKRSLVSTNTHSIHTFTGSKSHTSLLHPFVLSTYLLPTSHVTSSPLEKGREDTTCLQLKNVHRAVINISRRLSL